MRFQYGTEKDKEIVERELEQEVKQVLPDYTRKARIWDSPEHILHAYEFGSRCTFLAWEFLENRRLLENYFSSFAEQQNIAQQNGKTVFLIKQVPKQFQTNFNHGVMNSLGIPKSPNEMYIHLDLLMDCTKTRTKQELID